MTSAVAPGVTPGPGLIRLRRDGQVPLRFTGRLIARSARPRCQARLWHDLALYANAAGGYAVAIAARRDETAARCHAWLCDALEPALRLLEDHDPAGDVCPGLTAPSCDSNDPAISAHELAARAAELRAFGLDVERRYRTAVGALLARIAETGFSAPP